MNGGGWTRRSVSAISCQGRASPVGLSTGDFSAPISGGLRKRRAGERPPENRAVARGGLPLRQHQPKSVVAVTGHWIPTPREISFILSHALTPRVVTPSSRVSW